MQLGLSFSFLLGYIVSGIRYFLDYEGGDDSDGDRGLIFSDVTLEKFPCMVESRDDCFLG